MNLKEVMTKAEIGDVIRHFYMDSKGNKDPELELVVLKDNKLKIVVNNLIEDNLTDEELCDDNWEIVNEI